MEQGRGQVVGSIGAPGVGKSGLCYEFTQSQRPPGWLILASSPVVYGKDMPYFQVIDLLKAYFQLNAGAERQTIHEGRVLVSHDQSTMPAHFAALIQRQPSAGLLIVPQHLPYAIVVEDLLLIWVASEAEEWINRIAYLPL